MPWIGLRQPGDRPHECRQSTESVGGREQRLGFQHPPAQVFEVGQTVVGCELERCVLQDPGHLLVHQPLQARKGEVEHPPSHLGALDRRRKRCHVAVFQIHQQALGQHQRLGGAVQCFGEERVAGPRIGQVDGRPGQPAPRRLIGKKLRLLREQQRQVRLNPREISRKVQSIWSGVQAGGQVQHPVTAVGDRFGDGVVDDLGPRDQPPAVAARHRSAGDDGATLLTGEALGERIAEQRVGTC